MNTSYKLIFCTLILVIGCSVQKQSKETHMPKAPKVQESFTENKNQEISRRFNSAEPIAAWWKQFRDPQLNYLVDKGTKNNLDIKIAVANVFKSRAITDEVEADRLPTVNTNVSYVRQRLSEEGIFGNVADNTLNNYNAGFDAFWELDLFGRVTQRIDRAEALNEQALADLEFIYITTIAEIVRNYTQLRGLQYSLDIANRNLQNQKQTYELIQNMVQAGRGTQFDTTRAKSQLELTTAQIPELEAAIFRVIRRLSVLTGDIPNTLMSKLQQTKPLPNIPASVNIGNPQTLLRRRADIRRAEKALEQAFAEYNLAYADLFPEISLQGSLGFVATSFGRWLTGGALETTLGPSINWKILDIKRVLARIDQSDAQTRGQIAAYQKVTLEALEELENAISDFSKEEKKAFKLNSRCKS